MNYFSHPRYKFFVLPSAPLLMVETDNVTLTCAVRLGTGEGVKIEDLESNIVTVKWADVNGTDFCDVQNESLLENFELNVTASGCLVKTGLYSCTATYMGYSNSSVINVTVPFEG